MHPSVGPATKRAHLDVGAALIFGLYSCGRHSYGLYSDGLHSYGLHLNVGVGFSGGIIAYGGAFLRISGPLQPTQLLQAAHTTITGSPHHYYRQPTPLLQAAEPRHFGWPSASLQLFFVRSVPTANAEDPCRSEGYLATWLARTFSGATCPPDSIWPSEKLPEIDLRSGRSTCRSLPSVS